MSILSWLRRSPVSRQRKLKLMGVEGNTIRTGVACDLSGAIRFDRGQGNEIVFGNRAKFRGSIRFTGSDNRVVIGDDCHFRGHILVRDNRQTVTFGDHSTTVDVYILCQEGCDVTIGRWCMLSRKIEIRTTDAHSVIERETGRRINMAAPIIIGDHVWVGVGAIINKGSVIPEDSIVGAGAFVNRPFEESGVIIAGVPAKIVQRGVTWHRSRKLKFTLDEMDYWR